MRRVRWFAVVLVLCALGLAGCVGPGLEPPGDSSGSKGGFGNMDNGSPAGNSGTAGTSVGTAGVGNSGGAGSGAGAAGTGGFVSADAGAQPVDTEDGGVPDDAALDADMP